MLPKAEPDALSKVTSITTLPITPLIETAAGLLTTVEMVATEGVERLAIGEADLSAELGVAAGEDGIELLYARSRLVIASAAAGIDAPTGPVFTNFGDPDGLRRSTEALARLGFGSRPAIHPAQVPVINEVLTPTAQELSDARDLIQSHQEALAAGSGAGAADGVMFDAAVVRQARRVLARAERTP